MQLFNNYLRLYTNMIRQLNNLIVKCSVEEGFSRRDMITYMHACPGDVYVCENSGKLRKVS